MKASSTAFHWACSLSLGSRLVECEQALVVTFGQVVHPGKFSTPEAQS
jgi:hypothetical protein